MTPKPPSAKGRRQLRPKLPRLPAFMDDAEADALAYNYMTFAAQHRAKLLSTNPIDCVNDEVKRRTDVMGMTGPGLMPSIAGKRRQLHYPQRHFSAEVQMIVREQMAVIGAVGGHARKACVAATHLSRQGRKTARARWDRRAVG
jgi:Transposase, Mutator family